MTGIERIAAERKRQIEEEGFTAEYDDKCHYEKLAMNAICYALSCGSRKILDENGDTLFNVFWSSDMSHWKPTPDNRIRELEKAGALIAAEIDRLLRLEGKE